jgi:hypothetical protein
MTPPLLDATFTSADEDAVIRIPELKLYREIKSLQKLFLIDDKGKELVPLTLATSGNTDKRIWRWDGSGAMVLAKGVPYILGLKAQLKPRDEGAAEELWEVEDFSIYVTGVQSGASKELIPQEYHKPLHQTAQARLTVVTNSGAATGSFPWGSNKLLATFAFSGTTIAGGAQLGLEALTLTVESTGVQLTNVRIGDGSEVNTAECSKDPAQPNKLFCDTIPAALRIINGAPRELSVYGNVTLLSGQSTGTIQFTIDDPGTVGRAGAVRWTDATGHYNWIDLPRPLAMGTKWTVKP